MAATKKPRVKTITSQISDPRAGGRSDQSYTYNEVCEWGSRRFRIVIHIDSSYKFQCRVHIDLWDGQKWHLVHSIQHGMLKTTKSAYSDGKPTRHDVEADREELLRVAMAVVGPEPSATPG